MENKYFKVVLIVILIILLVVGGLYLFYLMDENPSDNPISSKQKVTLTVASEGPYDVDKFCQEVRTHPYYKGYDNETVEWLDKYDNYQILSSSNAFVVISKGEIGKIHVLNANDAFINETFECEIVENRSLGSGLKDVLVVRDIDYKYETVGSMLK